uniref:RanBP2-type domain-containing protein n=1 Tax=Strongyloides papillosus TaxID=174720 RepID=A0A0N5CG02_STREA
MFANNTSSLSQGQHDIQNNGENPLMNKESWGEYLQCSGDQSKYTNSYEGTSNIFQEGEKYQNEDTTYNAGLGYTNDGGSGGYNDNVIGERDSNSANHDDNDYNRSDKKQSSGGDKYQGGSVSKESVFFSGIPINVDENYIKEVFGCGGQIAVSEYNGRPKIKLYMDRGIFKGECMITYTNAMTAKEVIDKFNGSTFPGTESVLTANYAVFKDRSQGDSRGGRGGRGMRGGFRGGNRGGRGGPDRGNFNRNGYGQRSAPYGNPRDNPRGRGRGSFVDRGNSQGNINQGPMYGQYSGSDNYQGGHGNYPAPFRGRRDGNRGGGFSGERRGGFSTDRNNFRGGRGGGTGSYSSGRDSYGQSGGYQGYPDQGNKNGFNSRGGSNRGGRGNFRGNSSQSQSNRNPGNSEIRPNDWVCPCGNNNFAFRTECNKCKAPKRNCYPAPTNPSNTYQTDTNKGYNNNGPRANDNKDSQFF